MNHKTKIVLIALSLSMTGSSIVLLSQESKTGDAKVSFLLGKAHVQKPGKNYWESLKSNDSVYEGDLISTGNGSRITVLYKGSEFKIQQNSKVRLANLHGESKNGKLEINQGFAWFKIVNLKGKNSKLRPRIQRREFEVLRFQSYTIRKRRILPIALAKERWPFPIRMERKFFKSKAKGRSSLRKIRK